jgi:hypothetical protein
MAERAHEDGSDVGEAKGINQGFAVSQLPRALSPGLASASKEALSLHGKQSPLGSAVVSIQAAATERRTPGADRPDKVVGPTPAALPGGLRPTTSMSLRERAYLKSSMGSRVRNDRERDALRGRPLPAKTKAIPPLDLRMVRDGEVMGQKMGAGTKKVVLKPSPLINKAPLGLPPRPVSVQDMSLNVSRTEALLVGRPHSVSSTAGGSAKKPIQNASTSTHQETQNTTRSNLSVAKTAASETSPSRASTALPSLRLNTAELVRQNDILRRENEELRKSILRQANGATSTYYQAEERERVDTAGSDRSALLTALSSHSTVTSTTWHSKRRARTQTAVSGIMGSARSNLSTASSIKYFQGEDAPAETRIKALQAEIAEHQKREQLLRASLLAAGKSRMHTPKENQVPQTANLDVQVDAGVQRPWSRTTSCTVHSRVNARDEVAQSSRQHVAALAPPRTTNGKLTPYPSAHQSNSSVLSTSQPTARSNATEKSRANIPFDSFVRSGTPNSTTAVIGAQIVESHADKKQSSSGFLRDGLTNPLPVTSLGTHTFCLQSPISLGKDEWMAEGQKINPNSTVDMSISGRLKYPNKRLQTLACGGGGSYAYSALGRGPIMLESGMPVPDGLMVLSPVRTTDLADSGQGTEKDKTEGGRETASKLDGSTADSSMQRSKLRGDAEANSWHASQISSGLRWEALTREFTQKHVILCLYPCVPVTLLPGILPLASCANTCVQAHIATHIPVRNLTRVTNCCSTLDHAGAL